MTRAAPQKPCSDDTAQIRPVRVCDLVREYPDMRPPVVHGILRRGEVANIIAAPKVGKSFLAGNLAWCVADGRPWLSHDVTQGRVLILDNELHPETLSSRLDHIAREMQVDAAECNTIDVVSIRGLNLDIHALGLRLATIEQGYYSLAILDALYRTLPQGTNENDNAAMMSVYNRLDSYASNWNTAIAVVHHSSKGAQGDKSLTDMGAGAGAISRAADTHIVIRQHEQPELCVLECVTRSYRSPEPTSIQFVWPIWTAVTAAPEVKRPSRQSRDAQLQADRSEMAKMLEHIPNAPKAIQQATLFSRIEGGEGKLRRLMKKLLLDGLVTERARRKNGAKRKGIFYQKTNGSSDSSSDSDSELI